MFPHSQLNRDENLTDFGIFVELSNDLDGLIHLSDISWEKSGEEAIKDYKVDDLIKFKILEIDLDKERVSLGIKQLSSDPSKSDEIINKVVTGIVSEIDKDKVFVFNDWTFASSPSIRPFDHPVYDIWLKMCYS